MLKLLIFIFILIVFRHRPVICAKLVSPWQFSLGRSPDLPAKSYSLLACCIVWLFFSVFLIGSVCLVVSTIAVDFYLK